MKTTKILFVCHGNICRSPMAEFIAKDIVEKNGKSELFEISSAATSSEEIGNPIYPPAKQKLEEHSIKCSHHTARQITKADYEYYDYIIAMDEYNLYNLEMMLGEDVDDKISLLMTYAGEERDVCDPWYTRDFETTFNDISRGCQAFFDERLAMTD